MILRHLLNIDVSSAHETLLTGELGGGGTGEGVARGGAAPGRVREGGTPPAQLGGLGRSPRSQRFFLRRKPPKVRKSCTKNVITDRGWGATDQELSLYMFNAPLIAHVPNSPFICLKNTRHQSAE